jgi:[ribosomal protein S18]-alanine N-acetyltransferase
MKDNDAVCRSLGPAEADEMAALLTAAIANSSATGIRSWEADEIATSMTGKAAIALGIGAPLKGFILARHIVDEAEILLLAVRPEDQGKGLGLRLVEDFLATVRERGGQQAYLEVASDNHAAISVYQRSGFRITGKRNGYYNGHDALMMSVQLVT